ncbi:MAG: S-methyl-5'-thioadenosine phosphorylase [Candidatus Aenigmarchaeota archaeon]|nr:S-methyl-5'-thioadenosine phosphorylase [Candidatus Aenigmarchaeota archaeon]
MIGIFGGSGFYSLMESAKEKMIQTPYGNTSSPVRIGKIAGRDVAFIARHGAKHEYPPHKVPFRANVWAMKELGAECIITTTACGSLKKEIMPGDFIVPDQFFNATRRKDTFYDAETVHISAHEPYCPVLRKILSETAAKNGFRVHPSGTVVVIQGPRFSSRAESAFFRSQGFDIINMTQYPEVVLARELEMCYASVSIVTDYDVGLHSDPSIPPVSTENYLSVFKQNVEKVKKLIVDAVPCVPESRACACKDALDGAKI